MKFFSESQKLNFYIVYNLNNDVTRDYSFQLNQFI